MNKTNNEDLGRISVEEYKNSPKHPIVIVLDNIRSFHNVGSVFRTADAFRIEAVYLCGYTPCPPHRDIHKTALGATESVSWEYRESTLDAIHELKGQGYTVYGVEQAEPKTYLNELQVNGPIALVMGSEVGGIDEIALAVCDACLEIPQWGTKHSLNISVATGVVLWEVIRQIAPKH
jgi:23S rRNA (guanosine2251-2'-O)-methyltransferase